MKKRNQCLSCLLTLVFFAMLFLAGCTPNSGNPKPVSLENLKQVDKSDMVLGTFGTIRALAETEEKGAAAIDAAFQRIKDIEALMSASIVGSEIDQINANAGKSPVEVSDSTLLVIQEGLKYGALTDGNFNIGLGTLINLWGIGKEWQKVPTSAELETALQHIDLNQIEINGNQVFLKDPDMRMDLGGIAKGYAVDEAARVLRENGIENGFVNMGGDVYALGLKTDGTQWRMGIRTPEIDNNSIIARIPLSDRSIVTSGDYERYFVKNDLRYHHILDPESGFPTDNGLISVTIVSDLSIDGDVLSTSVFVMGLEKGLTFLEEQAGIDGILITKDRQVYVTSGIKSSLEMLDDTYKLAN